MKKIFFSFLFFAAASAGFCQTDTRFLCGTKTPVVPLIFTAEQMQYAQRTIDYQHVMNIYIHILANNDGSNPAITTAQMNTGLQTMANFFKPHNICFILLGFDYIYNTALNTMMNPYISGNVDALTSYNKHANSIDIYVHGSFTDPNLAGIAYDIPNDFISIRGSSFTLTTLPHEMGHALGLLHTFETAYGEECPNGSDCSGDGDLICDTPADFDGSQNMVAAGMPCVYTGVQATNCAIFPFVDLHAYDPSENNLMSYWRECRNTFTPQQGLRMRVTIGNEDVVNICQAAYNASFFAGNNDIIITGNWYASAKNEISIGSNGTGKVQILGGNPEKWLNAGTRIRLGPGTIVRPDITATKFIINPLCD
jgi:Pregnancy-associated plasma protein-A